MTDGPLIRYRALVDDGTLKPDPAQELAAEKLNSLFHALQSYKLKIGGKGWMDRFGLTGVYGAEPPPFGLYMYGGVGVGKSMLMDLLVDSMPARATRVHFHEFMRDIHNEVHRLRQLPGSDDGDPIPGIADGIADASTLLCFDEMEVRDIADAMIVARVFARLFERGVVVVTTSNRHPNDLYKDGLQRDKFLPFIELLKDRLDILQLEARQDYRLGRILGEAVYHTPSGDDATAALDAAWNRLTDNSDPQPDSLTVKGRKIVVPAAAHQVARFSFSDLCEQPMGASDYLEIGAQFCTVIVDRIPALGPEKRDVARRFVTLIDALYEHRSVLICSAATPPDTIYDGDDWKFEFQRTVSRLVEMQAEDYIRQRHVE
ncbi:MAG: cell division protein ZapE [Rhodospirillaceae bacterium]